MRWSDVIRHSQARLGETVSNTKFFTENDARDLISSIQTDVAIRTLCIERFRTFTSGPTISGETTVIDGESISLKGLTPANTDNYTLYWLLTTDGSDSIFRVYKTESGRDDGTENSDLVCSGTVESTSLPCAITLTADNTSGITGSINIETFSGSYEGSIYFPKTYPLNKDFLQPIELKYSDSIPLTQSTRKPRLGEIFYGKPSSYYIFDDSTIGFVPVPVTTDLTPISMWYIAKPTEYAFELYIDTDINDDISAVNVEISDTSFIYNITDSTSDMTYAILWSDVTTVTQLQSLINASATGLVMELSDSIDIETNVRKLEKREKSLTLSDRNMFYLELEIPQYMHPILVEGVVQHFREKDREYNPALIHKSKYEQMIDKYKKIYEGKRISDEQDYIKDSYCGNRGYSLSQALTAGGS